MFICTGGLFEEEAQKRTIKGPFYFDELFNIVNNKKDQSNLKKGNQTPSYFLDLTTFGSRFKNFNDLVLWMEINNDMSIQEFRDDTFWDYENRHPNGKLL